MYNFFAKVSCVRAQLGNKYHRGKNQRAKYYLRTPYEKIKEQVVRLSGYTTKNHQAII